MREQNYSDYKEQRFIVYKLIANKIIYLFLLTFKNEGKFNLKNKEHFRNIFQ